MRAGMLHSSYPPGWHPWAWRSAAKLIPGFKGVLGLPEPLGGSMSNGFHNSLVRSSFIAGPPLINTFRQDPSILDLPC